MCNHGVLDTENINFLYYHSPEFCGDHDVNKEREVYLSKGICKNEYGISTGVGILAITVNEVD